MPEARLAVSKVRARLIQPKVSGFSQLMAESYNILNHYRRIILSPWPTATSNSQWCLSIMFYVHHPFMRKTVKKTRVWETAALAQDKHRLFQVPDQSETTKLVHHCMICRCMGTEGLAHFWTPGSHSQLCSHLNGKSAEDWDKKITNAPRSFCTSHAGVCMQHHWLWFIHTECVHSLVIHVFIH